MINELIASLVLNISLWIWAALAFSVWRATRNHRRGRMVGALVLILIWLVQTTPVAEAVITPLENLHVAPSVQTLRAQGVTDVVVLTGGGFNGDHQLFASELPHASMSRFLAGMEICRQLERCRIIFSGSSGASSQLPTARVMDQLALRLLPELTAQSESQSNSTAEHPANVAKLVGPNRFVLVTSAYHMPRSMLVFQRAGLHPVAWPVDRYVQGEYDVFAWLPSAANLVTIQIAFHEYVGLIWYQLRP